MCGISGVRRYGDTPITREELYILLTSIEHRGNHASGIAIANADGTEVVIHKMPEPAWSFAKHPATQGFLDQHLKEDTSIVLLHTRFATCGTPLDNRNNHPMFDGQTAVIHNGSIGNHEHLFRSEELTPVCETDSDILRAIFDKEGFTEKAARQLSRAYGSAAIAAISSAYPGVLALGRSGNPLVYASVNDKLYFASEMQAIHKAVKVYENRHGLWMQHKKSAGFASHAMQNDTLYYLLPDGTSTHHELKICSSFTPPTYRSHENYADKMQTWVARDKPNRIFTRCRKCNTVQSKHENTAWDNLVCGADACKESFAYMMEGQVAHA